MATKKKKPPVTPYVSERIHELSKEHGWDPSTVEATVKKANKAPRRTSKKT